MSEDKSTPAKRTTKKAAVSTDTVKPTKTAASAAKTTPATPAKTTKKAAPVAADPIEPKKATAAPAKAAKKPAATVKAAPAKTVAKSAAAPKAVAPKVEAEPKKKASATRKSVSKPAAPSLEERQRWIATAAFHRAEKRGFAPGYEEQDWFDAEAEIDEMIGKA
ncbi:MAG: hypothetical protein B7Y41_07355 [Hydrogenophilales bacterium 28-61-23]|nr:MAG: hypothetical protein B7Y41_07355 [Hydrogenophilales bacterium 28-61-23]